MNEQSKNELENKLPVDFNGLILGFASAALHYIGHSSVEGQKKLEVNLPLSRQNIDIIELLKDKTQGNLSEQESSLISSVLEDLKVKYIEASKGKSSS